jgi:hypothetical protein
MDLRNLIIAASSGEGIAAAADYKGSSGIPLENRSRLLLMRLAAFGLCIEGHIWCSADLGNWVKVENHSNSSVSTVKPERTVREVATSGDNMTMSCRSLWKKDRARRLERKVHSTHRMSLFSLSKPVTKTPVRCMSRETLRRA